MIGSIFSSSPASASSQASVTENHTAALRNHDCQVLIEFAELAKSIRTPWQTDQTIPARRRIRQDRPCSQYRLSPLRYVARQLRTLGARATRTLSDRRADSSLLSMRVSARHSSSQSVGPTDVGGEAGNRGPDPNCESASGGAHA